MLPVFLSSSETFKCFFFQLLRPKCHPALMVDRSSQPPHPPTLSPLLPDMGVRSLSVVSDRVMSHASIPKICLITLLPYWVTEHTNFGPAENPLAISINTETCMNACMSTHNEMQTETVMFLHTQMQTCTK